MLNNKKKTLEVKDKKEKKIMRQLKECIEFNEKAFEEKECLLKSKVENDN